ncbi:MAG: hypothetical protein NC201_01400 [Prevotella sp.]|nr:hypothetical protein [Bacteroides sp.]MCM1365883.1 hypothetical protein [Prevotella sp.]
MIKKFFAVLGVVVLLVISGCKSKGGAEEMLDAIKSASEKLDKAKTSEERSAVTSELGQEMMRIQQEHSDVEISPEDREKIDNATRDFMIKAIKAETGDTPVSKEIMKDDKLDEK